MNRRGFFKLAALFGLAPKVVLAPPPLRFDPPWLIPTDDYDRDLYYYLARQSAEAIARDIDELIVRGLIEPDTLELRRLPEPQIAPKMWEATIRMNVA